MAMMNRLYRLTMAIVRGLKRAIDEEISSIEGFYQQYG
jgi:hypothetical protein